MEEAIPFGVFRNREQAFAGQSPGRCIRGGEADPEIGLVSFTVNPAWSSHSRGVFGQGTQAGFLL